MSHRTACRLLGLALLASEASLAQLPPPPPIHPSELRETATSTESPEPLAPAACPTGAIPNFLIGSVGCDGPSCFATYTWGAPSGADSGTEYEVLRQDFVPDYCATGSGYSLVGTTSQRSFSVTGLGPNRAFAVFVRVKGCSSQTDFAIVSDTFQTAPGPTAISAALVGQQVQVTFSRSDARTFGIPSVLRNRAGDPNATQLNLSSVFQNYCPVGSQKSFLDTPASSGTYTYYAVAFGNFAKGEAVVSGPSNAVTVSLCGTPSAPAFTASPSVLFGGQGYNASWSVPSGLQAGSTYTVETSRAPTFTTIDSSVSVATNSTVLPLPVSTVDYDLYVRVKAVQPCGTSSPYSASLKLTVKAAPASFLITKAGPSWTASTSSAPPTATVSFRNVGSTRGQLQMGVSGTAFFDVSPGFLDLNAGQEGSVTLTAKASFLATAGSRKGALVASSGSAGSLSTPVTLTVTSNPTPVGSRSGSKVRANVTTVMFSAAQGSNPAPQTVQVTLDRIVGTNPLYLSPSIGPGGAWLSLSNELSLPVPSSRVLNLTLSIDRSQQSSLDGAPPYRTLLTLTPVGGDADDAAVIEVVDQVPVPVGPGAGARGTAGARSSDPLAVTPPSNGSFIIPATVKGTGANDAAFYTDGWLRNIGVGTVPVELYYTPSGKDGLSDDSVLRATTSVGPGVTLRLADLLGALFRVNGSGQVELRSGAPGGLTLRTTVEAVTGGDPSLRFGTEIPTVSYGTGTGLNQGDLILPGISDDASNRCNLIVAETTGAAATLQVSLTSASGVALGNPIPLTVPPYGQAQVDGVVKKIAPGLDLTNGWLSVRVTAGSGKVVPLATVIDNRSNSFSAVKGSLVSAAAGREPASPDAGALSYIVPAAVKAGGVGGTQFTSSLRMVNGTATTANLTLTYTYEDLDAGGTKTAQKAVSLAPRAALPDSLGRDFLAALLGVPGQSRGWVRIDGDVGRITAVASISTLVDPQDPDKGVKTAQVNGFLSDVPDLIAIGQTERRFAGMEKTVSKRSNLILVETAGQPATVRLRAYSAAGQILAERSVDVAANQYYQINDFFSGDSGNGQPYGMQLGEGPFQNVEVAAQVVSGAGRIVGIATINDNISKNPEVFVLKDAGPPAPSIGF